MRRCKSCGTQLDPEWEMCWLCHAPVSETAEEFELVPVPDHVSSVDHVMSGPLARADAHSEQHDPIAATIYQHASRDHALLGKRGRVYATVLLVIVALGTTVLFLPYVGYAFTYGSLMAMLTGYALLRIWRGRRVFSRLSR